MKCALGIHSLIADISLVRGEAHSLRCSLRRAIGPTYAVEVLPSFFFFFRSSRLLTALTCAQYATANAAAAVRRGGGSSLLTCSKEGQQQLKAAALPNQQLEATTMLCSCRHCAPSCSSRTLFCSWQRRRRFHSALLVSEEAASSPFSFNSEGGEGGAAAQSGVSTCSPFLLSTMVTKCYYGGSK